MEIKEGFFVSICIPSYHSTNRPGNLANLLQSIDVADPAALEIVICDDKSPLIEEVRSAVLDFRKTGRYHLDFYENPENIGYDRNLKNVAGRALGEWIVFMGDDDEFVPGALDKLIVFLRQHDELGYVLKSHLTVRRGGIEKFRYYAGDKFFPPGPETLVELFRKSVFVSGFTIRRKFLPPPIDDFDSSLLYQHYLLGEVVLKHSAAYFDEPLTKQYDDDAAMPGGSGQQQAHAKRTPSIDTSIRFLKSFIRIPEYFDKKYELRTAPAIKIDMSKYFYPTLAVHRDKGLRTFFYYVREMGRLGYNCTIYYYIYVAGLAIFGKKFCDCLIMAIKRILGRTPDF